MFWLTISALILGTTVGSLAILVNFLALALKAAIVLQKQFHSGAAVLYRKNAIVPVASIG